MGWENNFLENITKNSGKEILVQLEIFPLKKFFCDEDFFGFTPKK